MAALAGTSKAAGPEAQAAAAMLHAAEAASKAADYGAENDNETSNAGAPLLVYWGLPIQEHHNPRPE